MRAQLLFLLLVIAPALAGPFAEVGIGMTFGACDLACPEAPVGFVAVGYHDPSTGLVFQVDHQSSMAHKDYGQNMVSIRYRWEEDMP